MGIRVRGASPTECAALSALALRSKGHWGYDADFLDACRAELTVDAGDLDRGRFAIAEDHGELLGFYGLDGAPPDGELSFFFVEPDKIGAGIGEALWQHCLVTAGGSGFERIRIESDPFAEGFYVAMGATRVGDAPSGSIPNRRLPVLIFTLEAPVELHPVDRLARPVA